MAVADYMRRHRQEIVLCGTVIPIVVLIYLLTGWPLWLMGPLSFVLTLIGRLVVWAIYRP